MKYYTLNNMLDMGEYHYIFFYYLSHKGHKNIYSSL